MDHMVQKKLYSNKGKYLQINVTIDYFFFAIYNLTLFCKHKIVIAIFCKMKMLFNLKS